MVKDSEMKAIKEKVDDSNIKVKVSKTFYTTEEYKQCKDIVENAFKETLLYFQ
jgi:hypothetical protein